MSAAGCYIPPMFVYSRQWMSLSWTKNGPVGEIYHCSPNGWSNSNLFLAWIHHFQTTVACNIDEPVLLILNNHVSHISLETYNFCRQNGIIMLSLVPHTSHRLQPLDVTFFRPLKKKLGNNAIFLSKPIEQKLFMMTFQS